MRARQAHWTVLLLRSIIPFSSDKVGQQKSQVNEHFCFISAGEVSHAFSYTDSKKQ